MSKDSGLNDLLEEHGGITQENQYRYYPYHEFEDTLWEWFEELENRFPIELRCSFIEISTRMSRIYAKAYYRDHGETIFIRFSKSYIEENPDWRIRQTLLHEMVHLYTYQIGFHEEISDGSVIFKWLCGQVGANVNQVRQNSQKWKELAEPFLDKELTRWS